MMELLQQLRELGVKLSSSYSPDFRSLSQLGNKLDTYEYFYLSCSGYQVNEYGTLHDMIEYAKAHPDQKLSLCHLM